MNADRTASYWRIGVSYDNCALATACTLQALSFLMPRIALTPGDLIAGLEKHRSHNPNAEDSLQAPADQGA
jgi:hypothetical protein